MCLNNVYERAILVYVVSSNVEDVDWNIKEFLSLASSSRIQILKILKSTSKVIHSRYFIGTGKVLELNSILKKESVSVVLFSCTLSPNQERNLTYFLKCKIIDRNQLILNIFAQRARTFEGKLQVELARLRYLNSRLTHEWSHLERQKGGIGVRGGPGETQLEKDRRLLSKQMVQLLSELKRIENQRKNNRCRRFKKGLSSVSIIGYTNAGKSTLFNAMTLSNVNVSEKLFDTLDPVFRRISDKKQSNLILIDTVGFIQNLPSSLITSFKSTLQEMLQALLILHVVDASSKKMDQNIDTVNNILGEINVGDIPILLVMNKIDKISKIVPRIDRNSEGLPVRVWVSARNRSGIALLKSAIAELIPNNMVHHELQVPINSDVYQKLCQLPSIEQFKIENENTVRVKVNVSSIYWNRLIKHNKLILQYMI